MFLALDHAVFSTKVYGRWADPISTAGKIISALDGFDHMRASNNGIVVVGDSRIGEGFSVAVADDIAAQSPTQAAFGKLAVPGTTPRIWYYLLRQTGLRGHHVKIVAIMLTSYHDNDRENLVDRSYDIAFLHPLVGPLDLFDLTASFESLALQGEAAEAVLLKGLSYNTDLHAFLAAPRQRILTAEAWHDHGAEWIRAYPGSAGSLAGLNFNLARGELVLPPHTSPALATKLQDYSSLLALSQGRLPDNAPSHAYRAEWLPRIAALCAAEDARLYVFRIPRGPLHFLVNDDGVPSGVVAQMQASGKLVLLPANLFDHLERPDYFSDQLHMNALGRSIFSRDLASVLLDRLGAGS